MAESFIAHGDKPRAVLIGADTGIAPILSFSAQLAMDQSAGRQLVLLHSETALAYRTRPSTIMIDGLPAGVIAALSLLDEQGIASRLSSHAEFPGWYEGMASDLAAAWLGTLNREAVNEVELYVCGPATLVQATEQVARRFGVPCQVLVMLS